MTEELYQARVLDVTEVRVGTEVTVDHAINALVLSVYDAQEFSDLGGELEIEGVVYPYNTADDEANTITLASALTVAVTADTEVFLYPAAIGKEAMVQVDEEDSAMARIPHHLIGVMDQLVRDEFDGESVLVRREGDEWSIYDLIGQTYQLYGQYIDPDTMPPSPAEPPPAPVTPLFVVTGMPRGFMLQVTNGLPGWLYTWTVSDVSTSIVQTYPATMRPIVYYEALPDGVEFNATNTDGWTWHVVATNESGSATSAESGAYALVLNDSNTISDLAVSKLIAGNFIGAFALLGALQVGASISINDEDGIVILQPNGGQIVFPADGSAANISSHLDAFSLTIRDRLKVQGVVNEISTGAEVTLASGITAPAASPTVSQYFPSVDAHFATGFEDTMQGLVRYDSNTWYATSVGWGWSDIRQTDHAGTQFVPAVNMPAGMYALGGMTIIGTTAYVLVYDTNRPENNGTQPYRWFIRRYTVGTWAYLGEIEYANYPNSTKNPAIGRNAAGTHILVARIASDYSWKVSRFAVSTNSYVDSLALDLTVNANITSVYQGTTDLGTSKFFVSHENYIYIFNDDGTYGRYIGYEWYPANSKKIRGLHWDTISSHWYQLDDQGKRWQFSNITQDVTRTIDYSWYDSDAGGTGVHESLRGPSKSYVQKKRSWMQVITSTPQDSGGTDDPDSVRIWINGNRQADLGSGVISATYEAPVIGTTSKAADFPAALVSARLKSGAADGVGPIIDLWGNGNFRLGAYTVARHHGARSRSLDQPLTHNTVTVLSWGTAIETTTGLTWDSTNNRFSVNKAGTYHVSVANPWSTSSSAGRRTIQIRLSGTAYATVDGAQTSTTPNVQHLCATIPCIVGDTIDVVGFQNSGASLSVLGGDSSRALFTCTFVGS